MFNLIILEDERVIRKKIINTITKIMMPHDTEYKIYEYADYNVDARDIIGTNLGRKIYILDIELPSKSGLDIARKIREKDWNSIIIFLTAHYELSIDVIKNRLMVLDFISKFNNYEDTLKSALETAIKIIDTRKTLNFENKHVLYQISLEDIIYIIKDTAERKAIVKTTCSEYKINDNISEIIKKLDNRFFQSHRSCIVNKDQISKVDFKDGKITFKNNEQIYMLSRDKKKGLKEHVGINCQNNFITDN